METSLIQAIIQSSNTFIVWSLSLIGASLAAILSTSYIKIVGKWVKLIYLLFVPGWIYLALSISLGSTISRRGIAAQITQNKFEEIFIKMNNEFSAQIEYFYKGLFFLGIWLFVFLFWWLLSDFFISKKY